MGVNPNYAIGIDLYYGNGDFNPAAAQNKIDFVIAKSSEGNARDPRFVEYHNICQSANIVFMAYHYFRTSVPWKVQADNFLGAIAGLNVQMLFWDYESKNNTLGVKSAADSVAAMSYLKQQTGLPVGLYADRQRTYEIYRDAQVSRAFPLWIAQYPVNRSAFDATPNIEPKHTPQFTEPINWRVWQFLSELNWGNNLGHAYGLESHSVDVNAWRGTVEEMRTYLGLFGGNAPPTPTMSIEDRLDRLEDTMGSVRDMLGLV